MRLWPLDFSAVFLEAGRFPGFAAEIQQEMVSGARVLLQKNRGFHKKTRCYRSEFGF